MKKRISKKRSTIKKVLDRFFYFLDPAVFGFLSSWGALFASLLIIKGFEINPIFSLLFYFIFAFSLFFLIKDAKHFKIGYVIGFIIGIIMLLKTYISL